MSIKVYEVINNRILELLEQGTVPWRKPWNAQSNYPKNLISGKKYQGVNVFMLAFSSIAVLGILLSNNARTREVM